MAKKTSELFKNLDTLCKVWGNIVKAVFEMGGSDEDILALQGHPHRVQAVAAAILGRMPTKERLSYYCRREEDEDFMTLHEMLRWAEQLPGKPCDERYARMLMENPTLIPEEERFRGIFIEGWRHPDDNDCVAYLCYNSGEMFVLWGYPDDECSPEDCVVRIESD